MSQEKKSFFAKYKFLILILAAAIAYNLFFTNRPSTSSSTKSTADAEKGVITTIKEIEKDSFKIINEEIIPLKENSRLVTEYMDGHRDTFKVSEILASDAGGDVNDVPETRYYRSPSYFTGFFYGSMLGYAFGGPSYGYGPRRGMYATDNAYQRSSTNAKPGVMKPSRTRSRSRSGYGSGRSTRSYGG